MTTRTFPRWLWLAWLAAGTAFVAVCRSVASAEVSFARFSTVFAVLAIAAVVTGLRVNRPSRPLIWYLLLAGMCLAAAGDVTSYVCEYILRMELWWPSWIDALYLTQFPMFVAGLFVLIRGRTSGRDRAGLIDGLIIATGLGLLSWIYIFQPLIDARSEGLVYLLASIAYPAGDVLLLVMLARLITTPGARKPAYWFLAGAVVCQLTYDTVFSLVEEVYAGDWLDYVWSGSLLCWGAAALHPSMRSLSEVAPDRAVRFTNWRLALLTATSLLAPGILAYQGITHRAQISWLPITVSAVALFLLVVARMSGLVRQIQDQAEQLASLAHNDGLTGIPNRRAWELELPRAMAQARRSGELLDVALIDLDRFKQFNDTHGHQAGDDLLRDAAAAWADALRGGEMLARYGGEEFTLLVRGGSASSAAVALARLRALTPQGQTFSAGLATWDRQETPQDLVGRADRALYLAKEAGRDRVVVDAVPARLALAAVPVEAA